MMEKMSNPHSKNEVAMFLWKVRMFLLVLALMKILFQMGFETKRTKTLSNFLKSFVAPKWPEITDLWSEVITSVTKVGGTIC